MKDKKRSAGFGAALIFLGLILGLLLGVAMTGPAEEIRLPVLRLPTGGISKPEGDTTGPTVAVGPGPTATPLFTGADAGYAQIRYGSDCAYRPELEKLLLQPIGWNLGQSGPAVLILHSHGSESYSRQPGQNYDETSEYRTLDKTYNMVAVGDALAKRLEDAGIGVIHDRSLHDYPSYNSAYNNARTAISGYLKQYPSIRLVLDLHRDAMLNSDGSQFTATTMVGSQRTAQVMMVVGTDATGLYHPRWQENLSLALKLQVLLEKKTPGITRPTLLRAQRFNQDLCPGGLIVEVGAAGSTLQEALGAVPLLADGIVTLLGDIRENSAT